jgi:hypothetical protein
MTAPNSAIHSPQISPRENYPLLGNQKGPKPFKGEASIIMKKMTANLREKIKANL